MSCRQHEAELLDEARGVRDRQVRSEAFREHLAACQACAERLRGERIVTAHLAALRAATAGARPSDELERRFLRALADEGETAAGVVTSPTPGRFDIASSVGATHALPLAAAMPGRLRWLALAAVVVLAAGVATWSALVRVAPTRPDGRIVSAAPLSPALPAPAIQPAGERAGDGQRVAAAAGKGSTSRRARSVTRPARSSAAADKATEFVEWPGAASLPAFESGELVRTELPASVLPLLGIGTAGVSDRGTVVADVIVGQDGMARAVRLVR